MSLYPWADLDLDLGVTLSVTLTPFLNSTRQGISNELLLDYDLDLGVTLNVTLTPIFKLYSPRAFI